MTKKQKAQRIIGIILLTVLAIPVMILSIPATGTHIVWHESGGIPNMITSEYVTITYTPIVELLRNMKAIPGDILFLGGCAGLVALGVWLIVHSTRRRAELKEA